MINQEEDILDLCTNNQFCMLNQYPCPTTFSTTNGQSWIDLALCSLEFPPMQTGGTHFPRLKTSKPIRKTSLTSSKKRSNRMSHSQEHANQGNTGGTQSWYNFTERSKEHSAEEQGFLNLHSELSIICGTSVAFLNVSVASPFGAC